ncbi:hypothetical protein [Allokutzneria albata]|nr:hypothetical protein [Allokutzneria albata]
MCVQIPSIYKAARYPFTDPVWAELPGSEYDARPRKSKREQCAALTQTGDQCRFGRDSDVEFTAQDARFCCRHNPARHCGRATRANRPCSAYTIDGSACEFHDGMPRMVVAATCASETPAVQDDQDDADVEEIDASENLAREQGAFVPERAEDELLDSTLDPQEVHPRLSTPWPRLNAALQGGFEVGQIVAVSSADHRFASRMLRGLSDHLLKEGLRVERLYCDKRETTVNEVLEWAELHISSGADALVLDWFPNILTDAATLDDDWRELPPADVLTRLSGELHHRIVGEPTVLFVGACMDPGTRKDAPGAQVVTYPLHEEASAIEYLARTWLITYPAPSPYKNTVGWLRRAPSDVERVKEAIPLIRT